MCDPDFPNGANAETNFRNSIVLMQAINEILFMERMKKLAPGIAKELMRLGVKFPK